MYVKEQMDNSFEQHIYEYFTVRKILKETDTKTILRVRHKKSSKDFVFRKQEGSADVYQKLISIKCMYLPEIFEAVQADETVLVLEEFVSGDSVSEMLKAAAFSEKETKKISMDICRALVTLHSLNIVHRDVKPENIILCGDHAVLMDLDAARFIRKNNLKHDGICTDGTDRLKDSAYPTGEGINEASTGRDTVILGTTGYAAPEQYGISETDERADIYALGITMNVMLTGEHPSVRLAPGRMGRIISRCVMMHPDRRFTDIRHLMEDLA